MSDYLSPEQQDPEQRIRELERGLGDTSHPNPHQSTPFPEQAVAASAGSMPTWAPSPVRSGYPSAPMWRPGSGVQRSRRWVAVLLGVVLPLGMAIAVTVPWKDLGLLDGVFGPTQVPRGGSLMVNESNDTVTIACNDGHLTLNGTNLTATVAGHCASLFVNGWHHRVTVDSADSIDVNGMDTVVIYHSGQPGISKNGNVTVEQG